MDTILRLLNKNKVRYLVIGGQAIRLSGMPRFTMDWDLYIPNKDVANMTLLNDVLADYLDFEVEPMGPRGQNFVQTYQVPWGVIQFHLAPLGLPPFDVCEAQSVSRTTENGVVVPCVSDQNLLRAKQAADRPKDQEDIEFLELKLGPSKEM